MFNKEVAKKLGTTNERLNEIFSAVMPREDDKSDKAEKCRKDCKVQESMQKWMQSTLDDSTTRNLKSYSLSAAADIAFDTNPVQPYHIPLNLYAQGKINLQKCAEKLQSAGYGEQFVKKDSAGNATAIDAQAYSDFVLNLGRFVVMRRLAPRIARFSNLWPYWKYESRSTGSVGKCIAEFWSQVADIMADDFGHREHVEQVIRQSLIHAAQVSFISCPWYKEEEPVVDYPEGLEESGKTKTKIVRQGLFFEHPHKTRTFWNFDMPLSWLNTDRLSWIGYWDTVPYRSLADNPSFYKVNTVSFSPTFWDNVLGVFSSYAEQYLQVVRPTIPPEPTTTEAEATTNTNVIDPASANDQKAASTAYTSNMRDQSVLVATVFKKIVPAKIGCGNYPFPVWVRFIVAGNSGTIIHAEFCPSRPGAYLGIDVNDMRKENASLLLQALPFQEQISRLVTATLLSITSENVKCFVINKDIFKNDDAAEGKLKALRDQLEAAVRFNDPVVLEASLSELREMEIDISKGVISVVETRGGGQTASMLMDAAFKVMALMERVLGMSNAEQGQAAHHEISATESTHIEGTRQEIGELYDVAIDAYRAALKRIIFESAVSCYEGEIVAPVMSRFPKEVVQKAGFKIVDGTEETYPEIEGAGRYTLKATAASAIPFSAIFTTRDGGDRLTQMQASNQLVQMLQYTLPIPGVLEGMGKENFYKILNEIFHSLNIDVVFEREQGESNTFGQNEIEDLKQVSLQTLSQIEGLTKKTIAIEDAVKQVSPELAARIQAALEMQAEQEQIAQQQTPPPQ